MKLEKRVEVRGALRTLKYDEVLDEVSSVEGKKIIADSNIEVTVGANVYRGDTIARSLMVDLLVQDLTAPKTTSNGRVKWADEDEVVSLQGMTVPIADVIEAHNKATLEAQLIFG